MNEVFAWLKNNTTESGSIKWYVYIFPHLSNADEQELHKVLGGQGRKGRRTIWTPEDTRAAHSRDREAPIGCENHLTTPLGDREKIGIRV
jgi:hypothetical protein